MKQILEAYEMIVAILSMIAFVLTLILKHTKSKKLKRALKNITLIEQVLREAMYQAEVLKNFTGSERREYVMTKVNQYCIAHHIEYQEEEILQAIEDNITLSKRINQKEEL